MASATVLRRVWKPASADAMSQHLKRHKRRGLFGFHHVRVGVLFQFRQMIPSGYVCPCASMYIGVDTVQVCLFSADKRMFIFCDELGVKFTYSHDSGEIIEGASKKKCRELMASFWEKRDGSA